MRSWPSCAAPPWSSSTQLGEDLGLDLSPPDPAGLSDMALNTAPRDRRDARRGGRLGADLGRALARRRARALVRQLAEELWPSWSSPPWGSADDLLRQRDRRQGPRCVRTLDPDAPLGSAMPVCGAPVAGGPGLRARYCPACHRGADHAGAVPAPGAELPAQRSWLLPLQDELEEVFG